MIKKETYWSKFANDFENRANYIVGKNDVEIIKKSYQNKNL